MMYHCLGHSTSCSISTICRTLIAVIDWRISRTTRVVHHSRPYIHRERHLAGFGRRGSCISGLSFPLAVIETPAAGSGRFSIGHRSITVLHLGTRTSVDLAKSGASHHIVELDVTRTTRRELERIRVGSLLGRVQGEQTFVRILLLASRVHSRRQVLV